MILVTGARGYIGSVLTERLRAAGRELYTQRFDVENPYTYPDIRPDVIVHLAGGGGPAETMRDALGAFRTNVIGTQRLVEWANAKEARVVYPSSCYVYAPTPDRLDVIDECTLPDPDTLYGAMKTSAEIPVLTSGGIVLRLAHVYGPSPVWQDSVTGLFVRAAINGKPITVHGSGRASYEYVHIEDVCAAFLRAIEDTYTGVLNVGTEETLSVGGLADLCFVEGASEIRHAGKDGPITYRCMDSSRAKNVLDWSPERRLIPSLNEWIRALRD